MNDEMRRLDAENPERGSAAYGEAHRASRFDDSTSAEESTNAIRNHTAGDYAPNAPDGLHQGTIMLDAESDLSATSDDRLIALLCYWTQLVMPLVMPIIVLLSESGKRRAFQRDHAIQSLGLTGAILGLTMAAFVAAVATMPFTGPLVMLIALCLAPIGYFMGVSAYVFYGWQAHKGIRFSIPYLSRFLRKQGWMD